MYGHKDLQALQDSSLKMQSWIRKQTFSPDNEKTPTLRGGEVNDDIILILDLGVPGIDFTTRISTTVLRIQRISAPFNRFP